MINALWLIPAFIVGACVGVLLMGLCCANSENKNKRKEWWTEV